LQIAALLPQSGSLAHLGKAFLDASQMAMFKTANGNVELKVYDTGEGEEEARQAALQALNEGAEVLLGPIRAADVRAIAPIAQSQRVPVLAFSNDATVAGFDTYVLGFDPQQQIATIIDFARTRSLTRINLLVPDSVYGARVREAANALSHTHTHISLRTQTYRAQDQDQRPTLAQITRHEADLYILAATSASAFNLLVSQLDYLDVNPPETVIIGLQPVDSFPSLEREPSMQGIWYVAPPDQNRVRFNDDFSGLYGYNAPRLASLAYDGMALAIKMVQNRRLGQIDGDLTNPSGFTGVDGLLRFSSSGVNDRRYAIFEISPRGRQMIIMPAETFADGPEASG
ncbi:MAG: penicillin-binding protein activator, partial [Pseudomonadota bacterium]